ncbi:complex I NDUFA9 subunit family protein [Marivibrio halodurans]|uniref:Complex I NDUFA9 subunit family protein n=1 Tax=Marivibrio halodurans TaxID=2039722 RepID=A0A8J7SJS9_9PROT|nr:complex I NDUFA9 subunit family protein [Marivibrio halodurans]MBP5857963.1 complex I NDUFA9 subunit family protein [Marivibrio halodurans]
MTVQLVTIFGGSGFIGRQIVRELARLGCQIRVAVRDPHGALPLKPCGDVGQITPIQANVASERQVKAACEGADAVINLVGILHEKGGRGFEAMHVQAARRIAEAAKAGGAGRFVQMSALGASTESPARYAQSKARGEAAVREVVPDAVVLRPSVVFGPEDNFFNRFAQLMRFSPIMPLIGGGQQKFQPVYVGDVADALRMATLERAMAGETYELGGPNIYSFQELLELIMAETDRHVGLVPLPFELARLQAALLELLPVPPLTRDQVELLRADNICTGRHPGLRDLGIAPTAPELILPSYLDVYRKGGRFKRMRPV